MTGATPFQRRAAEEQRQQNERILELMEQRTQSAKGAHRVAAHLRIKEAVVTAADQLAVAAEQSFEQGTLPEAVLNALILYRTQQRSAAQLLEAFEGKRP